MTWVVYRKAFDRMPYIWIIKSLQLIRINNKVKAFTKKAMTYCGTLCAYTRKMILLKQMI